MLEEQAKSLRRLERRLARLETGKAAQDGIEGGVIRRTGA